MISTAFKQRIIEQLRSRRSLYNGSDQQFSVTLGISPSQLSRVMRGDTEKVLSERKWMILADRFGVAQNESAVWETAATPVVEYIIAQLEECQRGALCGILADEVGIGKTFAAKYYWNTHAGVVYIDCSTCKTCRLFVAALARELGIEKSGTFDELRQDVILYLRSQSQKLLIILDEFGDLARESVMEVKALWNATEYSCGWYAMGATALKNKMEQCIERRIVGWSEVFDRLGHQFQRVLPDGKDDADEFKRRQAVAVIKANMPSATNAQLREMVLATDGNLRRIHQRITAIQTAV